MTPHQTLALATRLFAIWVGLEALRALPAFFVLNGSGYIYALFLVAVTVVLVLVLWFFPRVVAGKPFPPQDEQSQPSAAADTWLAMGCSLIGLWILTSRIPRLAIDIFVLNSLARYEAHSQLLRGILYDVVELAIAFWLVLGAKGFRKIFWWAQNAGTGKAL